MTTVSKNNKPHGICVWTADTAGNTRFTDPVFEGKTAFTDVKVEECKAAPTAGVMISNKG